MPESGQEDLMRKVSIVQSMLDRVIHTTDNLDEKVGRIFASMSFLVVGATILFTAFLADGLVLRIGGVDFVPLFFLAFVVSVALATANMLQAMGPKFHLFSSPKAMRSSSPSPTGYADKIATMEQSEWAGYFRDVALTDLYQKWFEETTQEVFLLSRKVEMKVGEMRRAQRWFLLAIVFFVLMLFSGTYSYF